MATSTAVTKSKRTAIDAQPFPRLDAQSIKEERMIALSDAQIAVQWLNAAKTPKTAASYGRVVSIRQQVEELRVLLIRLQKYLNPPAWKTGRRMLEEQGALVKAGKKGHAVHFPAIDTNTSEYKKLYRQADRLHSEVNQALGRYAFRPRVTYFVLSDVWRAGMVPDDNLRWFHTKIHGHTVSEADAVLSLVRLDLIGEVEKVRLCEMCRARWCVAAKSNYRFCSPGCRERFYATHPDYHGRKAANQRAYRQRLKQAEAFGRLLFTKARSGNRAKKRRKQK